MAHGLNAAYPNYHMPKPAPRNERRYPKGYRQTEETKVSTDTNIVNHHNGQQVIIESDFQLLLTPAGCAHARS
jgi:hypothetical protein